MNKRVAVSFQNPIDNVCFQDLDDVEFLCVLSFNRTPFEYENWWGLGLRASRLFLRTSQMFVSRFTQAIFLQDFNNSLLVKAETFIIDRCFEVVCERKPNDEEKRFWSDKNEIRLMEIFSILFFSNECRELDGLTLPWISDQVYDNMQDSSLRYVQQDIYSNRVFRRIAGSFKKRRKLSQKKNVLRLAICLFPNCFVDLGLLSARLNAKFEIRFEAHGFLHHEIDSEKLEDFDIFITNNNMLYENIDAKLDRIRSSSCVTVCWHWDSHHMFELTESLVRCFDFVFPAHSNGSSALQAQSSTVGPIVPCSVFQWSASEAQYFGRLLSSTPRSDLLYGRFNSFAGRPGLRDIFLNSLDKNIQHDIRVIPMEANKWMSAQANERFLELAKNKSVICNSIYLDVPARLFDALFAGAVPVIPYSIGDLDLSFTPEERDSLPIVRYIQDDVESLASAHEEAIRHFDREGEEGVVRRHRVASEKHMVINRVHRIVSEVMERERQ